MIKTLSISLLLFFLADAIGCILFLLVDWYEIKKEMAHLLDSKEMESKTITLTFHQEEFAKVQWIEKDHEFFYEGKLYDIISSKKENNITKIQCVVDAKEASLFQTMGKWVTHDQSDANHEHSFLLSVFKFLSGLVFQFIALPTHPDMASIRPLDAFTNHYHFIFHSFPIQPPDQVSISL
ncbi:MAG TPA: hypothetical protein VFV79_11000 [Saprospiraceae bacterium]|nr:hypothetical protein [Saprospiraceae bacterium]